MAMKRNHVFPFPLIITCLCVVFSLIIISCDRSVSNQLDTIEQEILTNPKSAFDELSKMEKTNFRSQSHTARYALLMSLARDKAHVDVEDDSLIQVAVHYYQNRKDPSYKMLSFYSLGRVQRNANNNTGAIISFMKAKELAKEIPDWHYHGLAARNIADLYLDCHDYESARSNYQESASSFSSLGERYYAAYSFLGQAESEMAMGLYDSADSLLTDLTEYAREENRINLLGTVLKLQAAIQMKPGRTCPEKAISLYRQAGQLGYPIRHTDGYGTLATAFELLNQQDSVRYYLNLAEKHATTLVASVHLCNTKSRIYRHRGLYQEANAELEKGVEFHNKLVFNRENMQIANAISYFNKQEADRQSYKAAYRLKLLALSILTILALLCVVVLVFINRKRQIREKNRIIQEKENKIEDEIEQIREITEALQDERKTQSEMAKVINELIREKIAVVKICADAYETVKYGPKVTNSDPYRYLDDDPANKKTDELEKFLTALDDVRHNDSLYELLEESVNKWRKDLMRNLRKACETMNRPKFSEGDYRIIMLIYAGIPDRTIAFLMDMSCAAVRTRKTRYKERLAQNDIPNGQFFVQEMTHFVKS